MPRMNPETRRWRAANPCKRAIGSRTQVMNGNALKTAGGLTKKDLKKNPKTGRWVSVQVSKQSKDKYRNDPNVRGALQEKQELMKAGAIRSTRKRGPSKKCYSCKPPVCRRRSSRRKSGRASRPRRR